jgi:hypothetical protein
MTAREAAFDQARKRGSPSTEAQYSNVRSRQKRGIQDAAYNNRPLFDLEPTPIAVYEPAFARFVRNVHKKDIVPDDFKPEELQFALDLIRICSNHYADEHMLQAELRKLEFPGLGVLWETQTIDGIGPDGNSRPYNPEGGLKSRSPRSLWVVYIIIGEVKKAKGEGGCDASDQNQCYYIKLITSPEASILYYNQFVFVAYVLGNTEPV